MSELLNQLVSVLNSFYGLPGYALVTISCIVYGYLLKVTPKFPNNAIPMAVILLGAILNPLIADERAAGTTLRVWLIRNVLIGFIFGFIAWVLHNKVLSKIEDKIPFLSGLLANADQPATPTPNEPPKNPTG